MKVEYILAFWLIWWGVSWLPPLIVRVPFFGHMRLYYGITVAPFIFLNSRYTNIPEWVIAHEKRHIYQQRLLSPLIQAALYFGISFVMFLTYWIERGDISRAIGYAYWQNPFEIDARCNGGWYNKARCKDVFR